MPPEEIQQVLRRRPFQPFRVTLIDGRVYEVRHHAMAMLGRTWIAIGLPGSDTPDDVYDRITTVPLSYVAGLAPLDMTFGMEPA